MQGTCVKYAISPSSGTGIATNIALSVQITLLLFESFSWVVDATISLYWPSLALQDPDEYRVQRLTLLQQSMCQQISAFLLFLLKLTTPYSTELLI
jgi:hypothetical protein